MTLVANCPVRSTMEVVDEHYYNSPEFFISNANKYDKYDRKGPKIYVGEYAVTQNCGKGNLRAAVGEAAFMIGMERNSDVVVMSSYAPLFVNVGWRQWNPDAIVYDNARVCGTPSYYVQKLVQPSARRYRAGDGSRGRPGRQTLEGRRHRRRHLEHRGPSSRTSRSPKATRLLFQSDSANPLKGWKTMAGKWEAADGALRQTVKTENIRAIAGQKAWKDYTYSLKARKLGGDEGFLIMFNVRKRACQGMVEPRRLGQSSSRDRVGWDSRPGRPRQHRNGAAGTISASRSRVPRSAATSTTSWSTNVSVNPMKSLIARRQSGRSVGQCARQSDQCHRRTPGHADRLAGAWWKGRFRGRYRVDFQRRARMRTRSKSRRR